MNSHGHAVWLGPPIVVDARGPIWEAVLDRPGQGNAMSAEMVTALDDTLARAEREGAAAVVLRSSGRHFCTGFDLSAIANETDDTLLARFVRIELMLQRLARAPFLTVAVAAGRAIGAGADLFTACSLRIVQGEAGFSFPGARGFGLVLGTRRLCEAVGTQRALQWIESAGVIDAREALDTGLAAMSLGAEPVSRIVEQRVHGDAELGAALRKAASPPRESHEAMDLQRLVESACRPGLRDRILQYIQRNGARKPAPATHQET
ncbi:MAG: enoyl-CoA hydratase/isomerase family protein [Pseudomonadota bacterium]